MCTSLVTQGSKRDQNMFTKWPFKIFDLYYKCQMECKQNKFATKGCTTDSKDIDILKASRKVRSTKWRQSHFNQAAAATMNIDTAVFDPSMIDVFNFGDECHSW